MRDYNSIFHLRNALTGVITASSTVAGTLQGNAIDTIGFQDMIGVLCTGSLFGSGGTLAADINTGADLTVKFQEAATAAATGSDFTDITSGAINGTASVLGSAKFDVVGVAAGSVAAQLPMRQRKLYLQLNRSGAKRYIRVHASIAGSTGEISQYAISISVLLGKPRESAYIIDAVSYATSSADVQQGVTAGSVPVL